MGLSMTLTERLRRALEFDQNKLPPPYEMGSDPTDEKAVFCLGARVENARLQPIHTALLNCVSALDKIHDIDFREVRLCPLIAEEALLSLEAALERTSE